MATNGMTINGLNPLSALTADDKIPVWDTGASGEPTKEITAQNMANSVKSLANLVGTGDLDATPTEGSTKAVQSGGVFNAIAQSTASEQETIQGGGNFSIGIYRIGKLRILNIYNGSGLQPQISIQLAEKDKPLYYVTVGNWLPTDSNNSFGSRFVTISDTTGILNTSGDVFRGGWTVVYIANNSI